MTAAHEDRVARVRARVGSTLKGKYRLDRVVGVGGMAAVYAATHLRNASRVAVKLLHREVAVDESVRARFLREGYVANSVAHPGAVRILDDDTAEDGAVFLVMELLEGETLDARWERSGHRLGAREVSRLVYQLLDVLATAHEKGIVHRDIKPENLFLTRSGVLKVLDFGVARMLQGPVTSTRPGGIIGTPAFMAPEQVLDKIVDAQSDLWSVGATAFTLLSKRYVHEADSAGEMMVIVGSRPARSLALVAPDVPAVLASVVDRALMFEKSARWSDARAMQSALAGAYRDAFGAPIPEADEEDDDDGPHTPPAGMAAASGPRLSNRASSAVTVLTGATPVITEQVELPVAGEMPLGRARRLRLAILPVAGVVTIVFVGLVVAMTAGRPGGQPASEPARGAASPVTSAVREPSPDRSSEPASDWSAPASARSATKEPPSVPVESLPTVWPSPAVPAAIPAAPVSSFSSPPHVAAPARAPSGCTPPFTTDPATGKKKWKLECL
jgi:eukaryotic-like serine/threonine-protein kinase